MDLIKRGRNQVSFQMPSDEDFRETATCSELRLHLSPATVDLIESEKVTLGR